MHGGRQERRGRRSVDVVDVGVDTSVGVDISVDIAGAVVVAAAAASNDDDGGFDRRVGALLVILHVDRELRARAQRESERDDSEGNEDSKDKQRHTQIDRQTVKTDRQTDRQREIEETVEERGNEACLDGESVRLAVVSLVVEQQLQLGQFYVRLHARRPAIDE